MTSIVLICTVGGAHEPILKAIRQTTPDYVFFICSGKDPATGRPGSSTQILGKGKIIKAHLADDKFTLENIPTQAGLREDQFEVVEVLSDDLERAFETIRGLLLSLKERFPNARYLADYTGGTKTMTAALVAAALETDTVELQLVTGSRVDLIKVRSGMESATPVNVERIRLERTMLAYLLAWRRFAYGEAARGLASLKAPRDPDLNAELRTLRDLSQAFDAWDRFDHDTAFKLLDAYRPRIGQKLCHYLDVIKTLTTETPKREPMRLLDLWRNAQRRATQGRYDDAIARVYRLLEWSAQWLLRTRCAIDTSDVSPEQIPEGVQLDANSKGKLQAALVPAWDMIGRLLEDGPGQFVRSNRGQLLNHLATRNHSILAHGFKPVSESEWSDFSCWTEQQLMPMLLAQFSALKIYDLPPQLPTKPNWPI